MKNIKIYYVFLLSLILLFFTACTSTSYLVRVNSYSKNENVGNKYFLQVSENKLKDRGLSFEIEEFTRYIDTALMQKGYVKVKNIKDADEFIVFDYNISEPINHTYTYEEPVWDNVYRPRTRYRKIDGRYHPYTYWDRDYEIIGYQTRVNTKIVYNKNISLTSFNRAKNKNLWQVSGFLADENYDMRYVFPIILKGILPYIGVDSGQMVSVEIKEDDVELEMIRRGGVVSSSLAN